MGKKDGLGGDEVFCVYIETEPSLPGIVEVRLLGDDLVQFPLFTHEEIELRDSDLLKVTPEVSARIFTILLLCNFLNTLLTSIVKWTDFLFHGTHVGILKCLIPCYMHTGFCALERLGWLGRILAFKKLRVLDK